MILIIIIFFFINKKTPSTTFHSYFISEFMVNMKNVVIQNIFF